MHQIIENNKEQIIALCKKHYVKELYVFGSVTGSNFNEKSDIDFLYEIDINNFPDWATGNWDYNDNLIALELELSKILHRKVDMVPIMHVANQYLQKTIEASKVLLYAA